MNTKNKVLGAILLAAIAVIAGLVISTRFWEKPTEALQKGAPAASNQQAPDRAPNVLLNTGGGGTAVPTVVPTSIPVAPPVQPTAVPIQWFGPDMYNAMKTEIPFGDAQLWTYIQTWDGFDPGTTIHIVVPPGTVLIIRDYVGTRWQLTQPDFVRFEEMREEVRIRDRIFKPPLIVISGPNDITALEQFPSNWELRPFPGCN